MTEAIRVRHLSKRYRLGTGVAPYGRLTETLWTALTRPLKRASGSARSESRQDGHIWALHDVSFDVAEGEVVGIVGPNGAGKSTLLKIVSRITTPTQGHAELRGRVGSLLEVGTGFHPELTGRENVFLNGAVLGMRRTEIVRRFDEIIEFAGIGQFVDTPVKRYSSGMQVRLAFAVAAHLETEILLVDEVLAVGDVEFQRRCLGKMSDIASGGRTVLFVSHNLGAIGRLCSRVLWLDGGTIERDGPAASVIRSYLGRLHQGSARVRFAVRDGTPAQFLQVEMFDHQGRSSNDLEVGEPAAIEITYTLRQRVHGMHVGCILTTGDGQHVLSTADTDTCPDRFGVRLPGTYRARVELPVELLNVGTYDVAVGMGVPQVQLLDRQDAIRFRIGDPSGRSTRGGGAESPGLLFAELPWESEPVDVEAVR